MIRFVDFNKQIYGVLDDEEDPVEIEFGFYNTVTDKFFEFSSSCVFHSWDDFKEHYFLEFGPQGDDFYTLDRFESLSSHRLKNDKRI